MADLTPQAFAETSSAEAGGNKAQWITDTFTKDIPNRLPLTRAVVWFSANKTDQGETDWRVDSSPEALQAYQDAAKLDSYQGQLP